jgi:hypothetical protein
MESSVTNKPLANFELAVAVFKTICQTYPATEQAALAQGEIGDCYLQLTNYDAATNAYAQIVNSPQADISARSQAQIGLGIALEKMAGLAGGPDQTNLLNQALDNYLDVFNETNLRDGETKDDFWLKEAGLKAAPLVGLLNNAETERKFYESLKTALPQLTDAVEKKLAALPPGKN